MSLERTAIPRNVLDRILELERRLDDLEGFAALPVADPESGEGDTTYVSIVQEVEVGEGPGVDVTGTSPEQTVGLGGDTILVYHSDGSAVAEFAATDVGLTAALAAMTDGDVCELPDVTISGGPWTIEHGTLRGHSRSGSILDGQVTLSDGTALETLSVIRDEDDAGDVVAVVAPESGMATIYNCSIEARNATGSGYAVYGYCEHITLLYSTFIAESAGADSNPFLGSSTLVDEFDVDAASGSYTYGTYDTLVGHDYVVRVTGDFQYMHPTDFNNLWDAQWITTNGWTTTDRRANGVEFEDTTEPDADDTAYSADHIYLFTRAGTGSAFGVMTGDENPGDNAGTLHVEIFEDEVNTGTGVPFVYACVIENDAGRTNAVPLGGDRSAWRVTEYGGDHADDIAAGALTRHLPAPAAAGSYARDNGTNWVAQLGILLADLAGYVRGRIIRAGETAWEAYDASGLRKVLIGNGTDVVSRVLEAADLPSHAHTEADISDLDHTDASAIHGDVAGEIHAIAAKAAPVNADEIVVEDSESAPLWTKKRVALSALPMGASALDDLTDVDAAAPNNADVLTYDNGSGNWVAAAPTGGSGSGSAASDPVFHVAGALSVATDVNGAWIAPRGATIQYVYIYCRDPGSAGSTIVDVNLNGTSIFDTTQANRPTLAYDDADQVAKSGAPDVTILAENDVLSIDVDQVATGAADLTVIVALQVTATDAADITYAPTTAADWNSDADPGNVDDALDQLAGRVDDLEAGGGGNVYVEFSETLLTEGLDQNRNTSATATYQEQTIRVNTIITVDGLLWDIRAAGDYTLTIRNMAGDVLHTKAVTGVSAASADVEFAFDTDAMLFPGAYRVRMTSSAAVLWYDYNSSAEQAFSAFSIYGGLIYDGSPGTMKGPFKIKYYNSEWSLVS